MCLKIPKFQELLKRQRINEEGDSVATTSGEADKKEEAAKLLQPCLITGAVLRDYQLYGVNWVTSLYENGEYVLSVKVYQCLSYLSPIS